MATSIDPTKDNFTEAEFIEICNNKLYNKMHVGATITLSNTYCSTYEVIGINHDSTSNSVDIMAHTQVGSIAFSSSDNIYSTSSIRTWINGTYLSAFSIDIQNLARTMNINVATSLTTGVTLQDKVKILSCKELNLTTFHEYMPGYNNGYSEGEAYSDTFVAAPYGEYQPASRWRAAGTYGSSSYIWLRSPNTSSSQYAWIISSYGDIGYRVYTMSLGILPVLRFGSATVDPTKDSFTESEFITVCQNNLCGQMHTGATITLSNTYCSTYEVIGVNHDSTTNTVDIMPTTQVGNMAFGSSTYSTSTVRTWINGTYLSAFSNTIQSLAKTMDVMSATSLTEGTTLSDKVKLLSAVEMNVNSFDEYMPGYSTYKEGTAYTVFTAGAYDSSISDRWRAAGTYGNEDVYWLRSRNTFMTTNIWDLYCDGYIDNDVCTISGGVLPVLRFGDYGTGYQQILTRGVQSALDATNIVDGTLRYTTDTGFLYLDISNSTETKRIKISDIDNTKTEAEIFATLAPLPKVYISTDTYRSFIPITTSGTLSYIDLAEIQLELSDLTTDKDSPVWFTDPKEETNNPKYATNFTYNPKNNELKVQNVTATKVNGITITTIYDETTEEYEVEFGL